MVTLNYIRKKFGDISIEEGYDRLRKGTSDLPKEVKDFLKFYERDSAVKYLAGFATTVPFITTNNEETR